MGTASEVLDLLGRLRGEPAAEEARKRLEQLHRDLLEAKEQLTSSREQAVQARLECVELREQIVDLRTQLQQAGHTRALRSDIGVRQGVYWLKGGKGPYCVPCFDAKDKLVMLLETEHAREQALPKWTCGSCKTRQGDSYPATGLGDMFIEAEF